MTPEQLADAERYLKLQALATKKTAYDIYGNGCLWTVAIHSKDSHLPFSAVVDALPPPKQGESK